MIGIDTNLLIYARLGGNPFQEAAAAFLESLSDDSGVVIAELVLVEYYMALRNPVLVDPPLSAAAAVKECALFRRHPRWQLLENADIMESVWKSASARGFARRRIIDVRLGKTLLAYGVDAFATANPKDFSGIGFKRVWNPLVSG